MHFLPKMISRLGGGSWNLQFHVYLSTGAPNKFGMRWPSRSQEEKEDVNARRTTPNTNHKQKVSDG